MRRAIRCSQIAGDEALGAIEGLWGSCTEEGDPDHPFYPLSFCTPFYVSRTVTVTVT